MSSDWYSKNFGGQPSRPAPQPPMTPPTTLPYNPVPQPQAPQEASQRLPQSAKTASSCPGCGSGNYGQVTSETKARCYDCGYPVVQAGSGVSGIGNSSGPTMPARQSTTANNFNPQGIIGHI